MSPSLRLRCLLIALLILVATTLAAVYLYGPMAGARLGIIDDHEILRFLGSDHRLSVAEIPALLVSATEVGQWGEASRFRPVYYAFRMIEASAFGDDATGWYVARIVAIVLIALAFSLLALAAVRRRTTTRAGWLAAAAFAGFVALSVVTLPSLPDMIMRLGPSEIYVAGGLAILALGTALIWYRSASPVGWVLLPLGLIIAVGSKEDAVILTAPFVAFYVLKFADMRLRPLVLGVGTIAVAFAGLVGLGVVLGSARNGGDIYGEGRSVRALIDLIPGNVFVGIAVLGVVVTLLTRVAPPALGGGRWARFRRSMLASPALLLAILALYAVIGELYFYQNNALPAGFAPSRYGFITILATVLSVTAAGYSLSSRLPTRRSARIVVVLALGALIVVSPFGRQYSNAASDYRPAATATAAATRAFSTSLEIGVADVEREPATQVALVAQRPFDYERVFSLPHFLAFYGDVDAVFVRMAGELDENASSYERDLWHQLDEMSKDGNLENGWRIDPIARWNPDQRTVCFAFGELAVEVDDCDAVHVVG